MPAKVWNGSTWIEMNGRSSTPSYRRRWNGYEWIRMGGWRWDGDSWEPLWQMGGVGIGTTTDPLFFNLDEAPLTTILSAYNLTKDPQ